VFGLAVIIAFPFQKAKLELTRNKTYVPSNIFLQIQYS